LRGSVSTDRSGTTRADASATHEPWTYLTLPEQQAIEHCAAAEADRLLALFAIGTGLRQGEQWSLELVDVHRDAKGLHVVVRYGSRGRKDGQPFARRPGSTVTFAATTSGTSRASSLVAGVWGDL
jgi:hypothetical protein